MTAPARLPRPARHDTGRVSLGDWRRVRSSGARAWRARPGLRSDGHFLRRGRPGSSAVARAIRTVERPRSATQAASDPRAEAECAPLLTRLDSLGSIEAGTGRAALLAAGRFLPAQSGF